MPGVGVGVGLERGMSGEVAPTYSISGTVYDADGSTAVAGATVAIGSDSAVSAADGTYTISDLAVGTSGSLTCTKTGYSWTAISIGAMSGNLTGQDFTNVWWAALGTATKCARAYRFRGAASLAAAKVNLKNPGTGDLTIPAGLSSPTWDYINGGKGNGSNQAFSTNYTPASMDETYIVQFTGGPAGTYAIFGVISGGTLYIYPNLSSTTRFVHQSSTLTVSDGGTAVGNLAITNKDAYKNGSDVGDLGAGTATYTGNVWLFAINNGGAFLQGWAGYIRAYAIYSPGLTPTELAAVATAMAALPATNP